MDGANTGKEVIAQSTAAVLISCLPHFASLDIVSMVNSYIEKRKFGRRAAFKAAVIVSDDGKRISGVVVDISEGGARFQTPNPEHIPKFFMLEIAADDFAVKCELVHRRADCVGMQFIASPRKISWGPVERRYFPAARDTLD